MSEIIVSVVILDSPGKVVGHWRLLYHKFERKSQINGSYLILKVQSYIIVARLGIGSRLVSRSGIRWFVGRFRLVGGGGVIRFVLGLVFRFVGWIFRLVFRICGRFVRGRGICGRFRGILRFVRWVRWRVTWFVALSRDHSRGQQTGSDDDEYLITKKSL